MISEGRFGCSTSVSFGDSRDPALLNGYAPGASEFMQQTYKVENIIWIEIGANSVESETLDNVYVALIESGSWSFRIGFFSFESFFVVDVFVFSFFLLSSLLDALRGDKRLNSECNASDLLSSCFLMFRFHGANFEL